MTCNLPNNLFSIFDKLDKSEFKNYKPIELDEEKRTKIILCFDKAIQQTRENTNLQSLISSFGTTNVIMKSHFKEEISPDEFLTAAHYYYKIIKEIGTNLNVFPKDSKTGIS